MLHHQINIFRVVVSLVILHDVGMVQSIQNSDLLQNGLELILQFLFIHDFNGNLHPVVLVPRKVNSTECALAQHLCVIVNVVVFQKLLLTTHLRCLKGLFGALT